MERKDKCDGLFCEMKLVARVLLSLFALVVCVGHISVIFVHFFGLVREHKSDYVSDLLNHNKLYMNLMTFFVLLQLTACFGFVRLHARRSTVTRVAIESLFLSLSWIGWCVLIARFEDGDRVSRLHFLGVGFFVGGGVVYFACLMWELYERNAHECFSGVLVLLYIVSVFSGIFFIVGYFSDWKSAWIFEHCGFMVFSLAHSYLFYLDAMMGEEGTLDEEEPQEQQTNLFVERRGESPMMFCNLRIQYNCIKA